MSAQIKKNSTILDYIKWRGDLSFDKDPFNEVDSLVMSTLSYIDFSPVPFVNNKREVAVTISDAVKALPKEDFLDREEIISLLRECKNSERYGKIRIFGYESEIDEETAMQFSAVTFVLPDNSIVIAFRGTDNTIIGWKEDFSISFSSVPAQKRAAEYANEICAIYPFSNIYLTGHSKGGNLAVFAAANLRESSLPFLLSVYNHDGPGFCDEFVKSEKHRAIESRVHKYVPESSIVGTLLEDEANKQIIASTQTSVMQHDPLSWEVCANHFVYLDERSSFGKHSQAVIDKWIASMSNEERKKLSDVIFNILQSSNAKTLDDLRGPDFLPNIIAMLKTYSGIEKEKKKLLMSLLGRLAESFKHETAGKGRFLLM